MPGNILVIQPMYYRFVYIVKVTFPNRLNTMSMKTGNLTKMRMSMMTVLWRNSEEENVGVGKEGMMKMRIIVLVMMRNMGMITEKTEKGGTMTVMRAWMIT